MALKSSHGVSRRSVLKAAAAGGAAAFASGAGLTAATLPQAPAVLTGTQAGRKIRAFVKYSDNPASVEQLTLRAIGKRQAAVRVEAAQCCYTEVRTALVTAKAPARAVILAHGCVGVVEAVGPQVLSVQVGDRVLIMDRGECGQCYNCLRMRADKCLNSGQTTPPEGPYADMGGTPVWNTHGGMTEVNVINEEQMVPVFTNLPAAELSNLNCVGTCGLGMATTLAPVEMASDVVVLGAGIIGLHAVQGAKIKGASQIIVVEPIKYRRELALKVGADIVLDPNAEGDGLVKKIQSLCQNQPAKTDRRWAGGGNKGPDHVIEAVGGDLLPPKAERGPDPTGILPLQQGWDLCSDIGTLVTCSVGQPEGAFVQIKASQWADGAKHHLPGTQGGCNTRRDVPRYIRMIEKGQFNMKALAPTTFPLERARDAYQAAADRTVISAAVLFNGTRA